MSPPPSLDVRTLFEANADSLSLSWVVGHDGADRIIARRAFEAADLVGHLNLMHPSRIQVVGHEESAYISRLPSQRNETLTRELIAGGPPALIIAEGLDCDPAMLRVCAEEHVPVLASPLPAARVIDMLRVYLTRALAEIVTMHGVLMDVLGMGVLISGESGLGKSELALELISRGHGLVADDVVELSRIAPNAIEGRCPPLLANMIEVRGLGLLDIKTIFGETAVRRRMKLNLIVHLVRRSTMENEYQRLPLEAQTQEVLGVPIREVVIPVAAGRNLAVLTEAAVRNTILKLRGIDTMTAFLERQRHMIDRDRNN
ncbi:MAG: HPr kinase/phosphorylase [Burkholderiales bacterium]|nr:MAG: HPr kinase/phosphorylase [Burkholderiales bacterium]